MKKLQPIFFAVITLVCMMAMQSCFSDETEQDPSTVSLNSISVDNGEIDLVVIPLEAGKFTITTKVNWTITAPGLTGTDGGWYTISAASGKGNTEITVTATPNGTGVQRTATLTVNGKYNDVPVTITQAADGDGMLDVSPETLTEFTVVNPATQTFEITSPFDWTITFEDKTVYADPSNPAIDPDWASVDVAGDEGNKTITVTAKSNGTGKARAGVFTITAVGKTKTVTITQAADGDGMLDVSPETLTEFTVVNPATQTFEITSPFDWTITFEDKTVYTDPSNPAIDPDWASVDVAGDEGNKTITVTAKNNGTGDARTGVFTITAMGKIKTVTVNQLTDLNHTFAPDFLAWCLGDNNGSRGRIDANEDGSISKEEAEAITKIYCNNMQLGSLKGIENFTKLTELRCFGNQLAALDVKANTALIELKCYINQLAALDVSKNTELTDLTCFDNNLDALDVKANTALTTLSCYNNQLTSLDVKANTELAELYCKGNPELATIDISGSSFEKLKKFNCTNIKAGATLSVWSGFNPNNAPSAPYWEYPLDLVCKLPERDNTFGMKFLGWCLDSSKGNVDANGDGSISKEEAEAVTKITCSNKQLGSLKGIENFTALTHLWCDDNQLKELDVKANTNLTDLTCNSNQLAALDVSKNTELTDLACNNNQLAALDVSKNTELTYLYCSYNPLSKLDVSKNTKLTNLICANNQLKELDVSKNTELADLIFHNNQLTSLDVKANTELTNLYCQDNPELAMIDISGSSFKKLKFFNCTGIKAGATVKVWSGFVDTDIPHTSIWQYPGGIQWVLP